MKRRTLITGSLWSSVLALVSPAHAALVPKPKTQPKPMSAYEAAKAVYDGFVSPEPDTEFVFDDACYKEEICRHNKVHCKLISRAIGVHQHYDTWLIFNDSIRTVSGLKIKTRQLVVSQMLKEAVHDLIPQERYCVEETFKSSWRQSGKNIVIINEFHYENSREQNFETGPIFRSNSQYSDDAQILALARFVSLITA